MKMNCVPKLSGLQQHINPLVSAGQKSRYILAGSSTLKSPTGCNHSIGRRSLSRLHQGSTGTESASKFIHVIVGKIQLLEGCWTEGLVSCWLLAGGCPQSFDSWASPTWQLVSLKSTRQSLLARRELQFFCNLITELTSCHFCCILLVRSTSRDPAHTQGERITWCEYQEVEIIACHLKSCPTIPPPSPLPYSA